MEIDVCEILKKFGEENRIFQSEAQFQFDLAWEIKKEYSSYEVLLEVLSFRTPKRKYSDIIVKDRDGNYIVIELKYKTKKKNIQGIELLEHGATDLGRYDFLLDLRRIELLKKRDENLFAFNHNLKKFVKGYAILLTNEHKYWDFSKAEHYDTLYRDFCISSKDSIKKGVPLKWNKKSTSCCVNETSRDENLEFDSDYDFSDKWQPYCDNFRYLIVPVE